MIRADLTGRRFGRLTALERLPGYLKLRVRCDCGSVVERRTSNVVYGKTTSCGCEARKVGMRSLKPLVGARFGRLLVTGRASAVGAKPVKWRVACDCGNTAIVLGGHLRSGHTASCGCLAVKSTIERTTTHGQSDTSLYRRWRAMLNRCQNEKCVAYQWYGARGIAVCERWGRFENFAADMGHPGRGMKLDRINNDLGYSPDNCRWVTHKENCNNRRNSRARQ